MEFTYWTDPSGAHFKEIRSRNLRSLMDLGDEYKKRGARVWLNIFDKCEKKWMLTVKED